MIYYALFSFMVAAFWFAVAANEIAKVDGWPTALSRGVVVMLVWPFWVALHVARTLAVVIAFILVRFVP